MLPIRTPTEKSTPEVIDPARRSGRQGLRREPPKERSSTRPTGTPPITPPCPQPPPLPKKNSSKTKTPPLKNATTKAPPEHHALRAQNWPSASRQPPHHRLT
ncbi:hypothetical protein P8452_49237 [Trifolium repens]|nr:hypothetical protein P8452_49237 [Trifolium repens]